MSTAGALSIRSDPIYVTAIEQPLVSERRSFECPAQMTLAEVVALVGFAQVPLERLRLSIDGTPTPVTRASMSRAFRPGAIVIVASLPAEAALSSFFALFLSADAAATAAAVTASVLKGAAISLATNLAANALFGTDPSSSSFDSLGASPTIAGARNQIGQGPLWRIYGTHRIQPFFMNPVTEVVGDDHYLRLLFVPPRRQ